jgi:L-lactate dehydrogenase complex protein LldG
MAERFAAELVQLSGKFVSLPAADVAVWLLGMLQERGVHDILSWQAADLPVPGVLDALRAGGIDILDGILPHAEPARSAAVARVEQVTLGLTGADAAFAETGSLALMSGPGRPRLASLSVRTHIALLDPRRLYASCAAWLAAEGPGAQGRLASASNLTLITGPSRTGDIEMTLTVGVHGPGELLVALVC